MKIKRLISLILVLALALTCCMVLNSCGDKDKGKDNDDNDTDVTPSTPTNKIYTVTILNDIDEPVEGVELTVSGKGLKKATTAANGTASFPFPEGTTVKVNISKVPNGYFKPATVSDNYHGVFAEGSYELTIKISTTDPNDDGNGGTTINPNPDNPNPNPNPDPNPPSGDQIAYTVTVVDQNGNAVSGVSVQICDDRSCQPSVVTNANGQASVNVHSSGSVHVKLEEKSGYTLPAEVVEGYHAETAPGVNGVTIVITKN